MTNNSIQALFANRFGIIVFVFGKLFRVLIYLAFIYFLFAGAKEIAGYAQNQALLFMTTFIFLGSAGQMFFREVYRFRGKVVSGDFDFDLVKPIHPLLRNIFGGFDLLDLVTMPIFTFVLVRTISLLTFNTRDLLFYFLLSANGMLIMFAIHVLVAALVAINHEVDHAVMIYRDIETMGRFPVDIYKEPLRQILTFVIPVGLMFTIPAKALLGLLSWQIIAVSFMVGFASVLLSLKFWDFAVKKYSSASS